jgi:hypothetical protein
MTIHEKVGKFINDFLHDLKYCQELVNFVEKKQNPKLENLSILNDNISEIIGGKNSSLLKKLFHSDKIGDITSAQHFALDVAKNEKFRANLKTISILPSQLKSFFEKLDNKGINNQETKEALTLLFQNYVLEQYISKKAVEAFAPNIKSNEERKEVVDLIELSKKPPINLDNEIARKLKNCVNNADKFFKIAQVKESLLELAKYQKDMEISKSDSLYIEFNNILINETSTNIAIASSFEFHIKQDEKQVDDIDGLLSQIQEKVQSKTVKNDGAAPNNSTQAKSAEPFAKNLHIEL